MDKLIEELVGKKEVTLFAILSVFAPSFMLVFVWNRNLFLDLEFLPLLVLTICLGIAIYIPNFVLSLVVYPKDEDLRLYIKDSEKDVTFEVIGIVVALITCAEIVILICFKTYRPKTSVKDFRNIGIPTYIGFTVLCSVTEFLHKIGKWIKTIIEKIREWLRDDMKSGKSRCRKAPFRDIMNISPTKKVDALELSEASKTDGSKTSEQTKWATVRDTYLDEE